MLCPICCFTCGKTLADKWIYYQTELKKLKKTKEDSIIDVNVSESFKSPESVLFDKLELERYCCKRVLLSHKDFN